MAGSWLAHDTDCIELWGPFSNVPTHYLIAEEGKQKEYGQRGMEALAVRWLFPGQEVKVDTRCLHCGDRIRIRTRDDEILEIEPETAVGSCRLRLPGRGGWPCFSVGVPAERCLLAVGVGRLGMGIK